MNFTMQKVYTKYTQRACISWSKINKTYQFSLNVYQFQTNTSVWICTELNIDLNIPPEDKEDFQTGKEYDVLLVQRGQGDYDHFDIDESNVEPSAEKDKVRNPKSTLCVLV